MSNENTNFVWAVFNSKDAAEEAAKSLKSWDKADKEIKLGAIGVVYLDNRFVERRFTQAELDLLQYIVEKIQRAYHTVELLLLEQCLCLSPGESL